MIDFDEMKKQCSELPENAKLSDEEISFKAKEEICLALLNDSNMGSQSERTLKKYSRMTDLEFEKFLQYHSEIHQVTVKAKGGAERHYRISNFF